MYKATSVSWGHLKFLTHTLQVTINNNTMINVEDVQKALSQFRLTDEHLQLNHVCGEYETSYGEGQPLTQYEYNYAFKHTTIEVVRVNETDWNCYLKTEYWDPHTEETTLGILTIQLGSEVEALEQLPDYIQLQHNRLEPNKSDETPLDLTLL